MSASLSPAEIDRFEQFLSGASTDSSAVEHKELCDRVLATLRFSSELSEADIGFMRSWLKARDLIVAGLQVLEMADEGSAEAIRHERECTEAAFDLLPALLNEARFHTPFA